MPSVDAVGLSPQRSEGLYGNLIGKMSMCIVVI